MKSVLKYHGIGLGDQLPRKLVSEGSKRWSRPPNDLVCISARWNWDPILASGLTSTSFNDSPKLAKWKTFNVALTKKTYQHRSLVHGNGTIMEGDNKIAEKSAWQLITVRARTGDRVDDLIPLGDMFCDQHRTPKNMSDKSRLMFGLGSQSPARL